MGMTSCIGLGQERPWEGGMKREIAEDGRKMEALHKPSGMPVVTVSQQPTAMKAGGLHH